jgi:(E)-4-hydroxy-3-methylbut-2-enyl-diphosphate synthase
MASIKYCNSLVQYSRLKTRQVMVGSVGIGGNNPIRVQSMTTTDTLNTDATVAQSIRMIEAGCELVRITAPSINEARNLENIKKELRQRGYDTPLVADIHFTPNAAEHAARIVEKVRINPGNYADKKKFETLVYTDASYAEELDRIRQRFIPLIRICKMYGTAMRIGTNHGSLSDRIMSRYGDTALGMVESALEFLRICQDENYHEIVLSMKSSNTQVMVQAYRLLINKMHQSGMDYPLHLGVTEAGEGEDGRIKSAVGIGTLLEDGIGDTIRVSLTEDPEFEIPVAKTLVARYTQRALHATIPQLPAHYEQCYSPFEHARKKSNVCLNIGGANVPRIIGVLNNASSSRQTIHQKAFFPFGYSYSVPLDKWHLSDQACDYIYTGNQLINFETPGTLGIIYNYNVWKTQNSQRCYPLLDVMQYLESETLHQHLNFVTVTTHTLNTLLQTTPKAGLVLIFETDNKHSMAALRQMVLLCMCNANWQYIPILFKLNYQGLNTSSLQLHAAADSGGLLIDGFGDGICIDANQTEASPKSINTLAFGVLQASRLRISKTEYISCPSCGRTLFDLQETTARIRSRTEHLKGVKIGIMGCIVNGPGEMADADYGYVGVGVGKITLYKGKEVVKRNLDTHLAVDALIDLIKQHGDWVEKETVPL